MGGVGFKGHDDTWLAHQDDFQNVLAALNVEHGEAGKNMDEDEKKATLSEISKKSKRRVHYQKFVKGKDTSNYSADDLGCILGTKSEKMKSKSEPSSLKVEAEEDSFEENKNFTQSGTDSSNYFAKKMADLKAKGKFADVPAWTEAKWNPRNLGLGAEKVEQKKVEVKTECSEKIDVVTDEQAEVKKTKKSKKKKDIEEDLEEASDEAPVKVKKKKAKKDRQERLDFESAPVVDVVEDDDEIIVEKKKKSKKSKIKKDEEQEIIEEALTELEEVSKKKKTKKSKKEKVMEAEVKYVEDDSGCENEETKSKKTKKGKKEKIKEKKPTYSDEEKENVKKNKRKSDQEDIDIEEPKKKKSRKSKSDSSTTDSTLTENSPKVPGFQGSNLLSIRGYGVEEKQ